MNEAFSNDNTLVASLATDAHGQAAMLLAESLIHVLIERNILSIADAVEIVDAAAEVKAEIDLDLRDMPANSRTSVDMLRAISASLKRDLPAE